MDIKNQELFMKEGAMEEEIVLQQTSCPPCDTSVNFCVDLVVPAPFVVQNQTGLAALDVSCLQCCLEPCETTAIVTNPCGGPNLICPIEVNVVRALGCINVYVNVIGNNPDNNQAANFCGHTTVCVDNVICYRCISEPDPCIDGFFNPTTVAITSISSNTTPCLNSIVTVSGTITLPPCCSDTTTTLTNPTPLTIASTSTPVYPSDIIVAGLTGTVDKVTVTINNFNDPQPDHESLLLVGPSGQKVIILFNVGNGIPVTNATITFDDAAASTLPFGGPITSGTFKPSVNGTPPNLPPTAPPGPYSTALSDFIGTNPNGTWSLYASDRFGGHGATIAGGWTLNITSCE